jgi:hypothetical protein
MIDPAYTDILLAARKATRAPKDEKPRSLEEAIANLEAITNRILDSARSKTVSVRSSRSSQP